MEIQGQVALITGGASGLGSATAKKLIALGAKVIIIDINPNTQTIAQDLSATGYLTDLCSAAQLEATLKEITSKQGKPRILINCAGIAPAKRIVGRESVIPLTEFSKVIEVNLIGTFNALRLCANIMSKLNAVNADGERGVIINTASIAYEDGQIGQAAYSASKGGVAAMTLPCARELAQFGIRVMTIAPGIFATPMLENMPDKVQESLAASIPFPKRLGMPEEYANLAVHIIENTMLNGEVIRLDAAVRMQGK